MSKMFSINFDEGPLELNDCNDSINLLQKIKVCDNCGKIRFIDPEYMGLCKDHKLISLKEALERNKKTVKKKVKKQVMCYLFITFLLFAVNVFLNVIIERKDFLSNFDYGLIFLIRICPFVCVLMIGIQLFYILGKINRNNENNDSDYGLLIRDFSAKDTSYLGETWEDAIMRGYADEISDLERWAIAAESKEDEYTWKKIYTAALELSHMVDCERLALLRLFCLGRIRLLPQSYTDISRIIKIVTDQVIIHWMDNIVKCFEHLCIPCDEETVKRVMDLSEYALKTSAEYTDDNKKELEQLLMRLFIAIGPYYVVSSMQSYSYGITDLVLKIAQKDKLYMLCMETMK